MPQTLIPASQTKHHDKHNPRESIAVSEMFTNTIQGEGFSIGVPATFMRLQGCVLNCHWCDTLDVWRYGQAYTFDALFRLFDEHKVIDALKAGQHFVVTGGSPLKQQESLIYFFKAFQKRYRFLPFIEVENECVLAVQEPFAQIVKQWNHSPKLSHSGMAKKIRYKENVIAQAAQLKNAWFKFVIQEDKDWHEIETDFLNKKLISKNQIIVMPMADTQQQLKQQRQKVVSLAIQHNVRFSDRLHITLYNKKNGV